MKILPWLCCGLLAVLALFFKFCVPGYSFSALVCVTLMGLVLFYTLLPLAAVRFPRGAMLAKRIVTTAVLLGLLVVGITEGLIIRASFGDPDIPVDFVVVLGAKVNPTGPSVSLWDRIHGAYDYLSTHPDVIAVVSGGQGSDEPVTEAQVMYEELTGMGIPGERIWMEDRATSTWENLHFSLDLIEEKTGTRPTTLGVLSSEYHLFRAGMFAKQCQVEFVGIPARTSRPSQMVNHFMREVAGVWHYILLGGKYD